MPSLAGSKVQTLRLRVRGIVQGVGFRPFVHRLATGLGLSGWVLNDPEGVLVEVRGPEVALDAFCQALRREAPPAARVDGVEELFREDGGSFRGLPSGKAPREGSWPPSSLPIWRSARTACGSFGTLRIPGTSTPTSTAPTADPATPSCWACPTIGPLPPCGIFPSVPGAKPNTTSP